MEQINLSAEENAFLRKYRKDVKSLPVYTDEQINVMIDEVAKGDQNKKTQLLTAMLSKVEEITKPMWGKGVTVDDMVQEGNLALLVSIELIASNKQTISLEEFKKQIYSAVKLAVDDQTKEKDEENGIANKLNKVLDAIDYFTKELKQELDLDELSNYLDIPVKEIEDLLKLAGQNLDEEEKEE